MKDTLKISRSKSCACKMLQKPFVLSQVLSFRKLTIRSSKDFQMMLLNFNEFISYSIEFIE